MEEHHTSPEAAGSIADESVRAITAERARVQAFTAAQRHDLERLDAELTGQIERIREELAREHGSLAERGRKLVEQTEAAAEHADGLSTQRRELEAQHRALESAQAIAVNKGEDQERELAVQKAEIDRQRQELSAALERFHHDEQALAAARDAHRADVERTGNEVRRIEEKEALLAKERAELDAERDALKEERRRLVDEFKEERESLHGELDERRRELETVAQGQQTDLEQALAAAREDREQAEHLARLRADELAAERASLETARDAATKAQREAERLTREVGELTERMGESSARWEAAQARVAQLEATDATAAETIERLRNELAASGEAGAKVSQSDAELQALAAEVEAARRDRELLIQRATDAEARATEAERRDTESPSAGDNSQELADLGRRYELAMDDLRETKRKNADLEKKLAAAPKTGASVPPSGMDWEAQKRRMLAALEADDAEEDEARRSERLKIEEVLRATEAALTEKDREVAELQELLEHQSNNLGSVAVGAAALGDLLDKDDIICQERQRLKQLQTEWEDKLRQAEVELSLQRAQIARARAEMDKRQRTLDDVKFRQAAESGSEKGEPKAPQRGRWLARLGLKDDEDGKP